MLGTGSWGKELGGGSIDIDFNLLSGSWEVRVGSGAASMDGVCRPSDTETCNLCGALGGVLYPRHEKLTKKTGQNDRKQI